MIALLVVLVGAALVAAPGLLPTLRRISGVEWARVTSTSLLLGGLAIVGGLTLVALPTVLRSMDAHAAAALCEHLVTPFAPRNDFVGWSAAALALVISARALRGARRARADASAARVEPWLGRHEDRGAFELVVLPTDALVAVGVPVTPPQVVISDGLIARLDRTQLDAVIRHEAAHHAHRHWRFLVLAAGVDEGLGPLPFVRRSTAALRDSLEAWADDGAVAASGGSRVELHGAAEQLTTAVSAPARVRARIHRLEARSPRWSIRARLLAYAPVLALSVLLVALTSAWLLHAEHAVAHAR